MMIDAHAHLKHGDAEKTEYTAAEIVQTMDAVGIDRAVIFAMSTTTRRSIEMAQAAVDQFPDRFIPYVYALPSYERPVLDELDEAIGSLGFRGIKIHVGECTLAEYVTDPVISLAGQRDVPCLIDFGGRLSEVARLARTFPRTRILVAHLGRYLCREEEPIDQCITLAERYPNLFLDVSGVVLTGKIREAVRRLGAERVVWGTDGPHRRPDTTRFAQAELDKIRSLGLSPGDEAMVLGGAISRLLNLSRG